MPITITITITITSPLSIDDESPSTIYRGTADQSSFPAPPKQCQPYFLATQEPDSDRHTTSSRRARTLEIRQFSMSSNTTIPTTEPSPSTSITPDASTTPAETPTTPSPVPSSPEPSVPPPSTQIPVTTPAGPSTVPTPTSPSDTESTPSASIPATASNVSSALTTDAPTPSSSLPPIISTITSTDAEGKTVTIVTTSTQSPVANSPSITATESAASSSVTADLQGSGSGSSGGGGLSNSGTIAVAVVVPIVAVALLVVAGLFLWRKRKARKDAEELRRKEVEEYGYNPNNDPTLPALGGAGSAGHDGSYEMKEDGSSGYRGWGTTAVGSSGRKASTTVSGGHSAGGIDNALMDGRPLSTDAEPLGAMGPAASGNRNGEINRGPSNASSSYSTAARSDGSAEGAGAGFYSNQYDTGNPYSADTQYGSPPAEMGGQPVIRDVQARRNTRIENPSHFPQQSAGISQNF
ncbi:uncharacterized protein L3040_000638 [Drepanopeziza brunnea f. sp. 'multigermtubi']|uniref:uncharacterized protein n=1 Tax=Drepanopeziza brunnea f. sp. 'multigermtubi' TaxID=698441 RepID=UPI00239CA796|nr:hypothetical protein L3040_000638 [Drepanopeziza brunnea f. sp. 'multigermtubi']